MTQGTLFRILLCVATQQVMGNKPSVKTGERFIFYGPDANGRSTDLQSDRLGSIPTVSTLIRWSVHLGVRIQGFHPCHTGSNPVPTTMSKRYSWVFKYPSKLNGDGTITIQGTRWESGWKILLAPK